MKGTPAMDTFTYEGSEYEILEADQIGDVFVIACRWLRDVPPPEAPHLTCRDCGLYARIISVRNPPTECAECGGSLVPASTSISNYYRQPVEIEEDDYELRPVRMVPAPCDEKPLEARPVRLLE